MRLDYAQFLELETFTRFGGMPDERQLTNLEATRRMVRQEEITAEIIELAAGESASRSVRHA